MANQKLTDRTLYASTLVAADLVHVVDVSDTSQDAAGSSFKLQLSQLKTFTDTGLWSLLGNSGTNPATNFLGTTDSQDLVFRTNNTEKVRITTAGYLGIGNSSASNAIDILGATTPLASIKVKQSTSTLIATTTLLNDAEGYLRLFKYGTTVTLSGSHPFIDADNASIGADKGLYLYSLGSAVSKGIYFYVGSSATSTLRMEISSAGFIGMGSVAVNNQRVTIYGSSTNSTEYGLIVHNSTATNYGLVVDNAGNVGLSTSTPSTKFHVLGGNALIEKTDSSQNTRLRVQGDSTQTQIIHYGTGTSFDPSHPYQNADVSLFWGGGSGGTFLANENSSDIYFLTGNGSSSSIKATITFSGNMGIGTTTPNATALLDLTSTTKGLLIPRMTTAQRTAMSNVAGMHVYDTDTANPYWNNGAGWTAY